MNKDMNTDANANKVSQSAIANQNSKVFEAEFFNEKTFIDYNLPLEISLCGRRDDADILNVLRDEVRTAISTTADTINYLNREALNNHGDKYLATFVSVSCSHLARSIKGYSNLLEKLDMQVKKSESRNKEAVK